MMDGTFQNRLLHRRRDEEDRCRSRLDDACHMTHRLRESLVGLRESMRCCHRNIRTHRHDGDEATCRQERQRLGRMLQRMNILRKRLLAAEVLQARRQAELNRAVHARQSLESNSGVPQTAYRKLHERTCRS